MKLLKASLLAAALNAFTLQAYIRPCPGDWNIRGEYLYLMPSFGDTFFVIDSTDEFSFIGSREFNNFGFHSGFRVGGAYTFCGCEQTIRGYYTRLHAHNTKTVTGDLLFPTLGNFGPIIDAYTGSAESELSLLYQRADIFFDQQLWCSCASNLSFLAGIEYSYIRLSEENDYFVPGADVLGEVDQKTKTWGIGPEMGFAFDYNLCDFTCDWSGSLTLTTFGAASLLASKSNVRASTILNDSIFYDITDQSTWQITTAIHARIGLNYATCLSCCGASLEVGYEFNSYLNVLARPRFNSSLDASSFNQYNDFDVQGLYVALDLTF